MWQPRGVRGPMIQLYWEIIQPMIKCSDTSESGSFSSWIPSLLHPKGGKLLRGNTCWHLFVSYKCFVFVVPMKSKYWVPLDLNLFAKEIGDPDAIICDADGKEKSNEVRKFRHHIWTTLRYLEESTPWANLSEMYICLIKESIRKDMKSCNRPLVFWDYCSERRARINNLNAKNLF